MLSAAVDEAMLLRSPVQNRFGGSTCPSFSLCLPQTIFYFPSCRKTAGPGTLPEVVSTHRKGGA